MTAKKVGDMTLAELESFIAQSVDEKLKRYLQPAQPINSAEVKSLLNAIARRRWTPPAGTPTASQMIQEEREQWRHGMS